MELSNYLNDTDKIGSDVWEPALQKKIGETIDVHEASTVRHIIGFMKSIGVIYEDASGGGEGPKSKSWCYTQW